MGVVLTPLWLNSMVEGNDDNYYEIIYVLVCCTAMMLVTRLSLEFLLMMYMIYVELHQQDFVMQYVNSRDGTIHSINASCQKYCDTTIHHCF